MKGFSVLKDAMDTMFFVAGVLILVGIVVSVYNFTGSLETYSYNNLQALEMSHSVVRCFRERSGMDYVSKDFLDSVSGNSLKSVCGIEWGKATVEDPEEGEKWYFSGDVTSPDHTIWISLFYSEDKIRMGRLDVRK